MAGVTLELLNDEGVVIATTVTTAGGQYRLDDFEETGDYRVRVVPPAGQAASASEVRDVLISRGGVSLGNVSFGLRPTLAGAANFAATARERTSTAREE
jgi:hypothetical protein